MLELTNGSGCANELLFMDFKNCDILSSYLITGSFTINMLLGLPANSYILWLSLKEMIQGQATEVFIFNTSLAEIIFCTSYFFAIQHFFFNCAFCEWVMIAFAFVLMVGRPLFQTCICVERYLGVLHPVTFLKFKPMKYRIMSADRVGGWILTICSCILVSMKVVRLYTFILSEFLIFFSTKLFMCLMVLKALLRPRPSEDVKGRNRVNRDKLKAFWIILIMLLSSVLTYGPSTVSLMLYNLIDLDHFVLSWSISLSLGLMSGFFQPFLYLKRVGKLPFC